MCENSRTLATTIECFLFLGVADAILRGGSFTSKSNLQETLRRFIEHFNETIAKPMNWTYTGRPTRGTPDQRPRFWREARRSGLAWKKVALVGMNL